MRWLPFLLVLAMPAAFAAGQPAPERLLYLDDTGAATGRSLYIVQLQQAPIAAKRRPGRVVAKAGGLRTDTAVVAAVAASRKRQDTILDTLGRPVDVVHRYHYTLDGFSAWLSAREAASLSALPGVLRVFADGERKVATDASPRFLELFASDTGLYSRGLNGEDIVIGVIDSGIAPEATSFRDTRPADSPRACRSNWGQTSLLGRWLCRRFRRRPDVVNYTAPAAWNGACEAGEGFAATDCNRKLLGARFYPDGALGIGPLDPREFLSPRDADGHGTHIAAAAAGNRVPAILNGSNVANIQGIAPRARLAAYKACWLRPGTTRASCATSDLVQAIDDAVADGVDVINYSIGNTDATVANADDVALLNAARSGVTVVVAAGNDGPDLGTIGSPAGSPWVITVGAATRAGGRFVPAMRVDSPARIAGNLPSVEAAFTPSLANSGDVTGALVVYDDADTSRADGMAGSSVDACQPAINAPALRGSIALIQRGGCDFDDKVANAQAAGADAVLVFSDFGGPVVMLGDSAGIDIPAVMIGQADGQQLRDALADDPVRVTLADGLFLTEPDSGNMLGVFSSRGPGLGAPGILKPDVVAPGVNILSATTPDVANGPRGQRFGYLTGTSMAAPHVAGTAALLRQAHPEWSAAAVRSAIMTTARRNLVLDDGVTAANPFEIGAGHIVPNAAFAPGLVFDLAPSDYDAFTCGVSGFPVDPAQCAALPEGVPPAQALNQPAIAIPALTRSTIVRRRVTATRSDSWRARLLLPVGFTGAVEPNALNLAAGDTAQFAVTVASDGGASDVWYFGAVEWLSDDGQIVRSPLAFRPVQIDAPVAVAASGGTGSLDVPVEAGYAGPYRAEVAGLIPAVVTADTVDADPERNFTRRTDNGVRAFVLDVPADQLYLRLALFDASTDGDDDLDLYVYYCPTSTSCREVGRSTGETSTEQVDIAGPDAGRYEVFVHGFTTDETAGGAGAAFSLYSWVLPNQVLGNASTSAPASVSAGDQFTVTLNWQALEAGRRYFGLLVHSGLTGAAALTRIAINNE